MRKSGGKQKNSIFTWLSRVINEIEDNCSFDNTQNIDNYFSLGINVDILNLEINPWISSHETGDEMVDYYSFTVDVSLTGWFDIDYGNEARVNVDDIVSYLIGNNCVGVDIYPSDIH